MKSAPTIFVWQTVEVMDPETGVVAMKMAMVPKYQKAAIKQFGDDEGTEYLLEQTADFSLPAHGGYMAAVQDHWNNLPEAVAARWDNPTHFRKWCLIHEGFYKEREFNVADVQTGKHIRIDDDYAQINATPDGKKIVVRVAKSQGRGPNAMKGDELKASRKAVLDLAEHFTGVPRGQAMKEAGRSA